MRATVFGKREPRIFTPPLRPLEPRSPETESRTLGYDVIDFATDMLELKLLPWQEFFFIHALELLPDGKLRFRKIVLLVARQNGKSTISLVLALFCLYILQWKTILSTAQDLDTAEEIWDLAVELIHETVEDDDGEEQFSRPWLEEQVTKLIQVNGKKGLVLKGRRRWKVKSAGRRPGRGFTGDLILADELREHQNWLAWAAITKTTQTREDALILGLSNAGDKLSVVLSTLRRTAHLALGDPDGLADKVSQLELHAAESEAEESGVDLEDDDDQLAIFEWSATPGCKLTDVDEIAQANPSLGYLIQLRTILGDAKTDPEWVFRTEVLCQWPDGLIQGPYPEGTWEACANTLVSVDGEQKLADQDRIVGDMVACVDITSDGKRAHLVVAGHRADGLPQVEVRASRIGTGWLKDYLMDPKVRSRITHITGQQKGAHASGLIADLANDEDFDIPVMPWGGPDLTKSYSDFQRAVTEKRIRHNDQPALTAGGLGAATRRLGDVDVIDRTGSTVDASPLVGAVGAFWLLRHRPEPEPIPEPPKVAAVQEDRSMVGGDIDVLTVAF